MDYTKTIFDDCQLKANIRNCRKEARGKGDCGGHYGDGHYGEDRTAELFCKEGFVKKRVVSATPKMGS